MPRLDAYLKLVYPQALCWLAGLAMVVAVALTPFAALGFQVLPKVSDVDRNLAELGEYKVLNPLA